MKHLKKTVCLLLISLAIVSCSSDDDTPPIEETPQGDYDNGILITHEGPFGTGTGTVSFLSEDLQTVENDIFQTVTGNQLGNIVQSLGFYEDLAYIVANNSNKITVVNRYTFEQVAVIESALVNPRYFVAINDRGYVSNWGDPFNNDDDYIAVIDLSTNTVIASIPVAFGPEQLMSSGDQLYVAHQGGFDYNNILSLIDTNTNVVTTTIEVGEVPNSMVLMGQDLWVLCGGKPAFTGDETNGSLYKVNTSSNSVSDSFNFETSQHPNNLTLAANLYYALDGGVYEMNTSASSLPNTFVLEAAIYGMTANEDRLYITDALDFQSNGSVSVYNTDNFQLITSFITGIIPRGIYFNN